MATMTRKKHYILLNFNYIEFNGKLKGDESEDRRKNKRELDMTQYKKRKERKMNR